MAFETGPLQLPGQVEWFPITSHDKEGKVTNLYRTKEKDIHRGQTHVGYFDEFNRKVMDTDQFTIPQRQAPAKQLGFDDYQRTLPHPDNPSYNMIPDEAFKPTDRVTHELRQANPKLNDYQFSLYAAKGAPSNRGYPNEVIVNHKPFTGVHSLEYRREVEQRPTYDVAELSWRNAPDLTSDSKKKVPGHEPGDPRTYGKISKVRVNPHDRGVGLAEAAFDYATKKHDQGAVGTAPMHDTNRSESGNIFAKRVGGPLPKRTGGQGTQNHRWG